MSHSRIAVLTYSAEEQEVNTDEILEEMETYGNQVDYVAGSPSSFESDYDWFMNIAKKWGFVPTEDKKGFIIEDKNLFWSKMTKDIQQILEDDGGVTDRNRFKLEDRLVMKRGFWIWYDGSLYTLPYFIEYLGNTPAEFKIQEFLDYHF